MFLNVKIFFNWQSFSYVYISFNSFIVSELMATIGCCVKIKSMKVDGVYQGFVFLGVLFIVSATFFYVCLLGYCVPKWLAFNLLLSLFAEVFIFVWMFVFVKKGIDDLKAMENWKVVAELCDDLRVCTLCAVGYSLIQLFFPGVDFHISMMYGANILLVALFFYVYITKKKKDIERRWTMDYFY